MSKICRESTILLYTLIGTYSSFALALINISTVSTFFELFRWVFFFCYILLSFYIFKFRAFVKIRLAFIFYLLFLLILILSTILFSGLNFDSIVSILPFVLILILAFLPYPIAYGNRSDFFILAYKKFSILFLMSIIPFLFMPDAYIMGRFAAWTKNTNIVAGLSVVSYGVVFISYIKDRNKYDLLGSVIYLLIIFLTQSRGALLSICFVTVIILLKNYNKKIFFQLSLIISILVALIFSNIEIREIENNYTDSNYSVFTVREFELGARQEIINRQLNAFFYSPLIGVGALNEINNPYSRYPAEASFTDLLSMVGLFGMFFYILALISRIKNFNDNDFVLLYILVLSFGEGYLTGIGSIVSIIAYTILLSER